MRRERGQKLPCLRSRQRNTREREQSGRHEVIEVRGREVLQREEWSSKKETTSREAFADN